MADSKSQMRLAVLGAGKMGGILIEAFVKQGLVSPKNIFATVQHAGRERKNASQLGVSLGNDNREAVKKADVVLLCVKPQSVGHVIDRKKTAHLNCRVRADRLHRASSQCERAGHSCHA